MAIKNDSEKIKELEAEIEKWKEAFRKRATHSAGCMMKNEHYGTPCQCGYSELMRELLEEDEDWTNWVLAKMPY